MPAIVDPDGPDGEPISVFEFGGDPAVSGAQDPGRFYGRGERERVQVEEWLFWQVGGIGPMAGQAHHFLRYAPEMEPPQDLPYAKGRYRGEVARLYGVLDRRLAGRDYVAGDYSIADMAIWPWANGWKNQQQDIARFPNMAAWLERVGSRPAVVAGAERRDRPDLGPDQGPRGAADPLRRRPLTGGGCRAAAGRAKGGESTRPGTPP